MQCERVVLCNRPDPGSWLYLFDLPLRRGDPVCTSRPTFKQAFDPYLCEVNLFVSECVVLSWRDDLHGCVSRSDTFADRCLSSRMATGCELCLFVCGAPCFHGDYVPHTIAQGRSESTGL